MPVSAASVTALVTGSSGPAADAVITLVPQGAGAMASHAPEKAVIRQKDETFLPLVVAVRRGGEVVFTNNDTTMHQVYSFSPIKQFEFEIDQGQVSKPVVFDKAGVAAIGCNIHDQMIAYVFVADAPFVAVSGAEGRAEFRDVPPGSYRAMLWHPQWPSGRALPTMEVAVSGDATRFTFTAPLLVMHGMKHMHMGY